MVRGAGQELNFALQAGRDFGPVEGVLEWRSSVEVSTMVIMLWMSWENVSVMLKVLEWAPDASNLGCRRRTLRTAGAAVMLLDLREIDELCVLRRHPLMSAKDAWRIVVVERCVGWMLVVFVVVRKRGRHAKLWLERRCGG